MCWLLLEVEDIEEIIDESEPETKAEAPEAEDEADVGDGGGDGDNQNKPNQSAGGTFKLGIDEGSELMDELTFSLQHCGGAGGGVEGQPPPGHWVSQPHGKYPYCSHSSYFYKLLAFCFNTMTGNPYILLNVQFLSRIKHSLYYDCCCYNILLCTASSD